ncbi:hypothetical protein PoB_002131900 [Plakobranchus ocellatus]|uniref:Uncharacterized protein n=1 Tax=Plakobranchus ocellatus TaxID=259542 RepID=A0AAV3ZHM0_9GAST|nr:hypothetical protein PoB_002131900 [Plakobranchus ocellatus]
MRHRRREKVNFRLRAQGYHRELPRKNTKSYRETESLFGVKISTDRRALVKPLDGSGRADVRVLEGMRIGVK